MNSNTIQCFWDKVDITPRCWVWNACKHITGYGLFWNGYKSSRAHRFSYELCVDKIPSGLCIDHLCRNRACVNPNHLEVVTNKENIGRGLTGVKNKHKIHCKYGHRITNENVYVHPNGSVVCRICSYNHRKEYNKRKLGDIE